MKCDAAGGEQTKLAQANEPPVAVESRRRILARLRESLRSRSTGPILITGEPGSGKTWISRQFVAGLPSGWRYSHVSLTSSLDALDFLTLVGAEIGLAQFGRLSTVRLGLQAALRDEHADGRNWLLIVDDAQRAAPAVWDELQVLGDQVRSPGGFGAVLISSDTELIRMVTTRRFRSFARSLRDHHHLPPLDLDEARDLLGLSAATDERRLLALEQIHRDAAGNPRQLLLLARRQGAILFGRTDGYEFSDGPRSDARAGSANGISVGGSNRNHQAGEMANGTAKPIDRIPPTSDPPLIASEVSPRIEKPAAATAPSVALAHALIASKPPIRIEDGLVEVGWEGDLGAEYNLPDEPIAASPESSAGELAPVQETIIEDRYAALQAWTEQATNRQLRARREAGAPGDPHTPSAGEPAELRKTADDEAPDDSELLNTPTPAKIRAEGQHEFAPYSQLFTRLRQSS
jgi:general secretion pathway protein A